jgi:hypothetical protein
VNSGQPQRYAGQPMRAGNVLNSFATERRQPRRSSRSAHAAEPLVTAYDAAPARPDYHESFAFERLQRCVRSVG